MASKRERQELAKALLPWALATSPKPGDWTFAAAKAYDAADDFLDYEPDSDAAAAEEEAEESGGEEHVPPPEDDDGGDGGDG